ncbi:MAG: murein biosynthesis integral membrane protein MurJ [Deltaproteobacteria bacterium]|nr:murein biosynthesis integral membrane protein MurJ [Deltaproteobacteria bacterium]
MSEEKTIARATGVVGTATLLSRILGYLRDMVIAYFFGAGMATDAFFVAFRIPNTLRRLFGEGSLTVSFIPVFSEYLHHRGEKDWEDLVNVAFTLLSVVLVGLSVAGMLFSPSLIRILAPGFVDPDQFRLAVLMTRLVFPYLFFIGLVALCMGVLNSLGHFAAPALAPALLNISMIGCAFLLFRRFNPPILALAVGVLVGGAAQLVFQIPFLVAKGIHFRPNFRFGSNPGIRRIGTLMVPAVLGTAVAQINVFVSQILASFLIKGSISFLYYAYRLIEFPLGIFVVALGTAALPSFSRLVVQDRLGEFADTIGFGLRMVFFLTIPASVGLILLRVPIVGLLFQRGEFDFRATILTSEALLYYALGLWAIAGVRIVAPAFFALQDMRSPVRVAVLALISNIVFGLILMVPLKHSGLALANSLSAVLNFLVLVVFLTKRVGNIEWTRVLKSLGKVSVASTAMGGVVYGMSLFGRWGSPGAGLFNATVLGLSVLAGIFVFLSVSVLVKAEETAFLISMIRERFKGKG